MTKGEQHILVMCVGMIPSVQVGVLNLLSELGRLYPLDTRFVLSGKAGLRDLVWADIIVCVRGYTPWEHFFFEYAARMGKFLIYYIDDDLMNLPETVSSYSRAFVLTAREYIPRIVSKAHVLWTNSPVIADNYGRYCKRTACVNAPAPVPESLPERKADGKVSILFAGSLDHTQILRDLLEDALIRVLDRYCGMVSLYILGANPGFAKTYPQIKLIPYEPDFQKYRQSVIDIGADIGLAPLPDAQFFHSKYYNKYLEYSTLGIAGIYSDVLPYSLVVKDCFNGILTVNTPEAWFDAICRLVEDEDLRKHVCENSRLQMEAEFSIDAVCTALLTQIPEITDYRYHATERFALPDMLIFSILSQTRYSRLAQFIQRHKWKVPIRIFQKIFRRH